MALVPFTGTISAATLNANFDDKTSTISSQALDGQKDWTVPLAFAAFSGTATVQFIPEDDHEVRMLFVRATDTVAGRTLTLTLTVSNGDASFLVDNTVSVAVTTIVGTADSRPSLLDLRLTSGPRVRVLKGVQYTLTLTASAGPMSSVAAGLQLRSLRRVA